MNEIMKVTMSIPLNENSVIKWLEVTISISL